MQQKHCDEQKQGNERVRAWFNLEIKDRISWEGGIRTETEHRKWKAAPGPVEGCVKD